MSTAKRISPDRCCGALIDVQRFFLMQVNRRLRERLVANTKSFVRLLGDYRMPLVVTLERPVEKKGRVPREIAGAFGEPLVTFEKDFFDLTEEEKIKAHFAKLRRKQVLVAGCETDVCVLQSCLGLLGLGYEVYVVEDLLFSSARDVDAALARMKAAGATFLTYKTLYYEIARSVRIGQDEV
jgi:nicotinamidase-related amidase